MSTPPASAGDARGPEAPLLHRIRRLQAAVEQACSPQKRGNWCRYWCSRYERSAATQASADLSTHTNWRRCVLVTFNLSRYSFVDEMDVVAGLASRPDLKKISPVEFEHLVRKLFEKRGMKSWGTQSSRDEGVDAVVVNEDPIVGGLYIIEAKRYGWSSSCSTMVPARPSTASRTFSGSRSAGPGPRGMDFCA